MLGIYEHVQCSGYCEAGSSARDSDCELGYGAGESEMFDTVGDKEWVVVGLCVVEVILCISPCAVQSGVFWSGQQSATGLIDGSIDWEWGE